MSIDRPQIIDDCPVTLRQKSVAKSRMERHQYDVTTGIFTGRAISSTGADEGAFLRQNTPVGFAFAEGVTDWRSQRVDIETGELVDYQPPAPDADHEWIHDDEKGQRVRRWMLKPAVLEQRERQGAARDQIAALELKQLRPMRELAIDPRNAEAKKRLAEIEEQILDARRKIS